MTLVNILKVLDRENVILLIISVFVKNRIFYLLNLAFNITSFLWRSNFVILVILNNTSKPIQISVQVLNKI